MDTTAPAVEEVLLIPLEEDGSAFERIQVEGVVKVQQTTPPPKDERLVKVEVNCLHSRYEHCGLLKNWRVWSDVCMF